MMDGETIKRAIVCTFGALDFWFGQPFELLNFGGSGSSVSYFTARLICREREFIQLSIDSVLEQPKVPSSLDST